MLKQALYSITDVRYSGDCSCSFEYRSWARDQKKSHISAFTVSDTHESINKNLHTFIKDSFLL